MSGSYKKVEDIRTAQPEVGVGVNPKWVEEGLVALFDYRQGMELISGDKATTNTSVYGTGKAGVAGDFSGTANMQFAHRASYAQTGPMTLIEFFDIDAASGYGAMSAKEGNTLTNQPFEFRLGVSSADTRLSFSRANSTIKTWDAGIGNNQLTVPSSANFIAITCSTGLVDTRPNIYVNNRKVLTLVSTGVGTGAVTDNGAAVWLSRRYDGVTQLDGRRYYTALFSKELVEAKLQELFENKWDLWEPEVRQVWVPVSGGSPTIITLDPATLNFTPQSTQNTVAATLSTATADFVPQNTQNTLGATLTTSALNFTAQDVQNSVTNNLTAVAFDFVAHDIAAENASTATVTLDTATFDFVANDNQNALYAELSTPAFDFVPNDTQNLLAQELTTGTFDFVGQDTQNTLGLLLENAIFDFVTRSITAGDPLAPTTGRATNMMLMGVGN